MVGEYQIFKLKQYDDNRGYFYESYPKYIGDQLGAQFVQDNLSFSNKRTIRGLHYQWNSPMGKLVQVIKGKIIDYIIDIRKESETFGKVYNFELSGLNRHCLWVPPGFGHGFEALEDSYVLYKCTSEYNSMGEGSLNIFDEELNINLFTNKESAIVSKRDKNAISFKEYCGNSKFFKEKL